MKIELIKSTYLTLAASFIFALPAMSYSPFLDQSFNLYSVRGRCEMCHSGTQLNSFGKDFDAQWRQTKNVVKAYLAVENKDSDGDGFTNIDEIKAMSLPGDKVSMPQMKNSYDKPDLFRQSNSIIK